MVLFGGLICPYTGTKFCPMMFSSYEGIDPIVAIGIKIFLLVWVVFVPIRQ